MLYVKLDTLFTETWYVPGVVTFYCYVVNVWITSKLTSRPKCYVKYVMWMATGQRSLSPQDNSRTYASSSHGKGCLNRSELLLLPAILLSDFHRLFWLGQRFGGTTSSSNGRGQQNATRNGLWWAAPWSDISRLHAFPRRAALWNGGHVMISNSLVWLTSPKPEPCSLINEEDFTPTAT